MKQEIYDEVEIHVPSIIHYSKEVENVEKFLRMKDINPDILSIIFWNHFITLLERIEGGNQNELELTDTEELSKDAQELTKEFVVYMKSHHVFELTEFEEYLIQIHFEQLMKGE